MSFEGVLQSTTEHLTTVLSAERCTIRVPNGQTLLIKAAYGTHEEARQKEIPIAGTIAGEAFITGKVVSTPDITKDPRYDPSYIDHEGPKCLVAIPLLVEETCYGVAQIYCQTPLSSQQESLANILSYSAALTLYHIEATKTSRKAILEVLGAIITCMTPKEMFSQAVRIIAERLSIESCLVYRIFPDNAARELRCEIVAGVPAGEHKIGLSNPLSAPQHADIAYAATKREVTILDPMVHNEAKHLLDWATYKNIRLLMEYPLVLGKRDKPEGEKVVGVIVGEARNGKYGFSAEEKSFFADAGKILANFIEHDQETFKEIAHELLNPNTSMGGYAKRLQTPLTQIYELAEECRASKNCPISEQIIDIAGKLLPSTVRIETEAKRVDLVFAKIKETALS